MPKLRHMADRKTLLYAFLLIPGVPALQYIEPALLGWLLPLQLYAGFVSGAIAHNHNHCPTFRTRRANSAFSAWLSVLYGAPLFGWIPTHNQNHHRFTNGPGDDTITWRYFRRNSLLSLLSYFFVSVRFQAPVLTSYLQQARRAQPRIYRQTVIERTAVAGSHVCMLGLAIGLHGPAAGVTVYAAAFLGQVAFALWSMFSINFFQHVDCDPGSDYDHSRNFVGRVSNLLMFNAGYHTAHTQQPGLHWSQLPAAHAAIAARIDPRLNQRSLLWFAFRTYGLGTLLSRFGTQQVGRAAWEFAPGENGAGLAERA
jgi:beta-carotene hydroxylase